MCAVWHVLYIIISLSIIVNEAHMSSQHTSCGRPPTIPLLSMVPNWVSMLIVHHTCAIHERVNQLKKTCGALGSTANICNLQLSWEPFDLK